MITSTRPRARIRCVTDSRSAGSNCTACSGRPALVPASASTSTRAAFEAYAEAEPRSRVALPLFSAMPAASAVTFGRASYTMPTTPSGTRTWRISSPLGSV